MERIICDRYRVMVIGSVPIKRLIGDSQEIETRKIAFSLRGEIDKTTLHKTNRERSSPRIDEWMRSVPAVARNQSFQHQ